MLDQAGRTLRSELLELFRAGVDRRVEDDEFDRLALRIFEYQFERNEPYAAYCRRRQRWPGNVESWMEIPAVPSAAFKEVALVCGEPDDAEAVFRTSGTTRGPERRGVHYIADLTIYHGALLSSFAAYLLPDGEELPMLSLVPSPEELRDSSLAHMISVVMDRLGSPESAYFASAAAGVDEDALDRALRRFQDEGAPVCLLGTSLAFLHWMDRNEAAGRRYRLPPGSRLMDTGGYKGSRRRVPADELLRRYDANLGIPPHACVNEYGMTELCSQFYDTVLRDQLAGRGAPAGERHKRPPPWVRTRVVDAETLEPARAGEVGILRHLDLANLGSVACVQTEDLGRSAEGDESFLLLGRAAGAPPRGCSVAMDLLLDAVGRKGG